MTKSAGSIDMDQYERAQQKRLVRERRGNERRKDKLQDIGFAASLIEGDVIQPAQEGGDHGYHE
jgi:hypothetical protein